MRKFEFKRKTSTETQRQFNLAQTIEKYLDTKRLEKRSERTVKTYEQTLRHFEGFCKERSLTGAENDCFTDYVRYMTFEKTKWDDHPTSISTTVGISARSVNNIIRVTRIFYNWSITRKLIGHNPAMAVGYQTEEESAFEVFTDDEIRALLNAPNQRTYTGLRDYVMMVLLVDCGLRVGELTALTRGDVDLPYRQIALRAETTKGRKARIIPFSPTTAEALRGLLDYIGIDDDADDEFIFLTQYGERYYGDTFAKMLKNYAARSVVRIKARVSPHTFRHYFAVKFLRNGGDPFALMKILGHADISMTQKYVRYAKGEVKEIHDKASPIESLMPARNKRKGSVKFR